MPEMDQAALPEQVFFADPALDRAVAMLMTVASELWVTKDRLHRLEGALLERGVLTEGLLDHRQPGAPERERVDADRQAFVAELMRCTLGQQVSKGAPDDLHQRFS